MHSKGKPLAKGVDLEVLARKTPGFTGADLANVLNEAALLTARSNAQLIDNRALDEAVDRVIAGPQRRSRVMKDKEKLITAYHEGGHALAAAAMNYTDPVTKITILPRGRALGYTMVLPLEDKYSVTRNELLDQLTYAMGGRVAEEIVFHDPSTGASNDIEKATSTARKMVTEYGMSANVGAVKLGQSQGEVFLGRDMGHQRDYSEEIAERVDAEVRALIEQAHDEAWQVLNDNRDILDKLAAELLEHETLDHKQIAEIFKDVKQAARAPAVALERPPPRLRPPADLVPRRRRCRSTRAPSTVASTRATRPSRSRRRRVRSARTRGPRRPSRPTTRRGGAMAGVDTARIERAVHEILLAIGEDPTRPGLERTPQRVAEAYADFFGGLDVDPLSHLADTVPHRGDRGGRARHVRRRRAARPRVPVGLRAPPAAVRRHRARRLPARRPGRRASAASRPSSTRSRRGRSCRSASPRRSPTPSRRASSRRACSSCSTPSTAASPRAAHGRSAAPPSRSRAAARSPSPPRAPRSSR